VIDQPKMELMSRSYSSFLARCATRWQEFDVIIGRHAMDAVVVGRLRNGPTIEEDVVMRGLSDRAAEMLVDELRATRRSE
jgi:hypothetical protein